MSVSEKISYLKGLAEGLNISKESNEGKLIYEIIKTLDLINEEMMEQEQAFEELEEYVSEIDDDLMAIEECFEEFEDEDDEDDECDCEECDCEDCDCFDDDFEEIQCPSCNEIIRYEGDIDVDDQIYCPVCNALLVGKEDEKTEEKQ